MGQAKLRGNKEERIAQSKARNQPPETVVYVSTKKPLGMCLLVEDVSFPDENFFLVELTDEASADDMSAMNNQFDQTNGLR